MKQEQVNQIVEAINGLTEQIHDLTYYLKGDGNHTIGDSLERIMLTMIQKQKEEK